MILSIMIQLQSVLKRMKIYKMQSRLTENERIDFNLSFFMLSKKINENTLSLIV